MLKLALLFVMLATASQAFAVSIPLGVARPIEKLNLKTNAGKFEFEGIVKLSNCSGALIKFEGQSETNKAIVMTNGHCADLPGGGFIQPGEIIANKKVARTIGIFDAKMALHRVKTTQFLYATMTETDVSFYELELTYKAIRDQFDVEAYTLSPKHPSVGTEMQIISGYWEKGWDCSVEAFIPTLKEDAYTWIDSIRYDEGCDTTHGTSGSPIIERNSRSVIGINNTGNDSGERCTMDNPCEVSTDGTVTVRKGVSYGQQTYRVYSCLTEKFAIDLRKPGCQLFKGSKN